MFDITEHTQAPPKVVEYVSQLNGIVNSLYPGLATDSREKLVADLATVVEDVRAVQKDKKGQPLPHPGRAQILLALVQLDAVIETSRKSK